MKDLGKIITAFYRVSLSVCAPQILLVLVSLLGLPHALLSIELSDGFNYPIGPRYPGSVTEDPDTDGWYNRQDFGNDDEDGGGFHAGEDWNDECGGINDIGAPVYAVSHGEVVGSREAFSGGGESIGEVLVLRHQLSDVITVYSLYLHIEVVDGLQGEVRRDQVIGTVADTAEPHLHFEIRTKAIDMQEDPWPIWPNDNDTQPNNAYYGGPNANENMAADGLDYNPSDFLDALRPATRDLERGRIPATFSFERDLGYGACRYEVRYLQILLNSDLYTKVAESGPGSPGNETSSYFDLTENAVMRFQEKHMEGAGTPGQVDAETRSALNRILREARESPNVDVALIIDSSGSMTSNDPNNGRLDAARAYLTGAFAGDSVGVVDFDSGVRLASPLRLLPENRDILIDAINTIDSAGGTNIGAGIQEGCNALTASPSEHILTKGALLLTDGQGGFTGEDQCFIDRGWPIFTFGLGSGADNQLLQQIALRTGGEHTVLPASALICEFQRVRSKIAGAEPPPCEVVTVYPFEFTTFFVIVESGQLQATFSIDWVGSDVVMTLTTPSGRQIDRDTVAPDVSHDHGATFEVYTITNPEVGSWEISLFGADVPVAGEETIFGFSTVPSPVTSVGIDIKPGSEPNPINPRARGNIPVAILTTESFDATTTDPLSVMFGPNAALEAHGTGHTEDCDGDGDYDLVLHFDTQDTGITCGMNSASVTAETIQGQAIEGEDSIITVGCD